MPFAAAIKFKDNGALKYFHPGDLDPEPDDFVWVKDPGFGVERIGFISSMEGRAAIQMHHLPRVLRYAGEDEIEGWYEQKIEEREMIEVARERARAHDLPIKVSDLAFIPERRQVIIQFTSDTRIDFRELVKDLAGHFKARIEMWQIGSRREAGLKDGFGICGNPLCCGSWLKDFPSISMRYAKDQDIVQPPSKLTGPCGKLRCCLRYEHETYLELADGVATRGCTGCSSDGKCGVVIDRNLLKGELTIKTTDGVLARVSAREFVEDDGEARREGDARPRAAGRIENPAEEVDETVEDRDEGGISATTGGTEAPPPPRESEREPERRRPPRRRGNRGDRRRDRGPGGGSSGDSA